MFCKECPGGGGGGGGDIAAGAAEAGESNSLRSSGDSGISSRSEGSSFPSGLLSKSLAAKFLASDSCFLMPPFAASAKTSALGLGAEFKA